MHLRDDDLFNTLFTTSLIAVVDVLKEARFKDENLHFQSIYSSKTSWFLMGRIYRYISTICHVLRHTSRARTTYWEYQRRMLANTSGNYTFVREWCPCCVLLVTNITNCSNAVHMKTCTYHEQQSKCNSKQRSRVWANWLDLTGTCRYADRLMSNSDSRWVAACCSYCSKHQLAS